ncbi:MAG: macro domain-containing protein [Methylococcaceae bacterium]
MIEVKKGNIFTTECQTIVNTVNCVGVMGAGIALEFKLRYPEMFNKYKIFCDDGLINIGNLWIYTIDNKEILGYTKILNFPTKEHWKYPTKKEYLEKGLQKFVDTYASKNIESIAFPLLGASKGGMNENDSIRIMKNYLSKCDIKIEIWHFDPTAKDDVYDEFKSVFMNLSDASIKEKSQLRNDAIKKIKSGLLMDDINSLSGLLKVKGIGATTLEKSFVLLKNV